MICPFCKSEINNDSYFCDMCGKELKFCPKCEVPKRGTECPICGSQLISGALFFSPRPVQLSESAQKMISHFPKYLVGEGMKLRLKSGTFGRIAGIYPELASCIYVSNTHGKFEIHSYGWCVIDLGSTNGTYLNGARLAPNKIYRLKIGDSLKISPRLSFTLQ